MKSSVRQNHGKGMQFGLMFFASSEDALSGDKYRLVIESAKFADCHGFSSVWIPERHFTKFGCLYPNPAVLHAALARETEQICLRAGSVVLPLHNPIRIAEEWAVVDNLSGGRVGISFASGWNPNDFAFFPERYANRHEELYSGIQKVRKLWHGEAIWVKSGNGEQAEVRTYPTPIQRHLPVWVTAASNPKTFIRAGEIGANLLTHMLDQDIKDLAEKIALYRQARATQGHDPEAGLVTIMLHTFIGNDVDVVREQVRVPYCEYLKSNVVPLLKSLGYSRGRDFDINALSPADVDGFVNFLFERFFSTRALLGTPETCLNLVGELDSVGVDEVACLLDFGPDAELILKNLPYLNQLKERYNAEAPPDHSSASMQRHKVIAPTTSLSTTDATCHGEPSLSETLPGLEQEDLPQEIQKRCQEEISGAEFYKGLREYGVEFDGSFQGIERLWRRDGEALGLVQLPEVLESEADAYKIHPAFLDACFQVFVATLPTDIFSNRGGVLYLPVGLHGFEVYSQLSQQIWSHAVLRSEVSETVDRFEGDVHIQDQAGKVLAKASGLRLQRTKLSEMPSQQHNLSDLLYQLHWQPKPLAPLSPEVALPPGCWLLLCDRTGVGQSLANLLTAQGKTCLTVTRADTYQVYDQDHYSLNPACPQQIHQLIEHILGPNKPPCRGVIHLWSLDATPSHLTTLDSLAADQELGVGSVLTLFQALTAADSASVPRVWLVTRGAQPVGSSLATLEIAQSPLWGLGKTWSVEHPELWGALVDLDPQAPATQAASQLLALLQTHDRDSENQNAFRQGQRYVPRLKRSQSLVSQQFSLRADASYLITGGLWGVGFEVARWLAQQGAQHLVLLGRTQLPPRASWSRVEPETRLARQIAGIEQLEALGIQVDYAAVDVADEAQLSAWFRAFCSEGHPPIRGVVHAASVWQDPQGQSLTRLLSLLDLAALQTVLRPKLMGTWLLHQLFKDAALDFFTLFSSGASLLGSAGQGNYAAANAFLDAFAHHLKACGQRALSINWGPVSEVGFGATAEGLKVHEYWEARGIERLSPDQVLAALEQLLPQDLVQIAVMRIDWHRWQRSYPHLTALPWVADLVATEPEQESAQRSEILQSLAVALPRERKELLVAHVQDQVAKVMALSPSHSPNPQQGLFEMGMDSLMALELKSRLQDSLGHDIPATLVFEHTTIEGIAGYLAQKVLCLELPASSNTESQQDNREQIDVLEKIQNLSDDEAEKLFTEKVLNAGLLR